MAKLGTLEWDVGVPGARSAEQQVRALDDQFEGAADSVREAERAVQDVEGASESAGREFGELNRRVTNLIGSFGALGNAVPDLGLGGGDGPGGPGGGGGGGGSGLVGGAGSGAAGGLLARLGLGGLGGAASVLGGGAAVGGGILGLAGISSFLTQEGPGTSTTVDAPGVPDTSTVDESTSILETLTGTDLDQQRGDILGPAATLGARGLQAQQDPLGTLVDVFSGGGGGGGSGRVAITGQGQERGRRRGPFVATTGQGQERHQMNLEIGSIEVQADGVSPESFTEADMRRFAEHIGDVLGREEGLRP